MLLLLKIGRGIRTKPLPNWSLHSNEFQIAKNQLELNLSILNSTFLFAQLASNMHIFLILVPIHELFELLDCWALKPYVVCPKMISISAPNFIAKSRYVLLPDFEFQIFHVNLIAFVSDLLYLCGLPSILLNNIHFLSFCLWLTHFVFVWPFHAS